MKKLTTSLLLLIVLQATIVAQWTDEQNAEYVIGQPNFTTYTSGATTQKFDGPKQAAIDYTNNKLYIVDVNNYRVLRFTYPITSNYPTAEMYFGGSYGTTQNTLAYPSGVAVYNGVLWVADMNNSRILKFSNAHLASNSPNADGVLGQTNYTTGTNATAQNRLNRPEGICIDANGNLWVADRNNYRVLKFTNVNSKSNGANADLVLGAVNFTTRSWGTTQTSLWDAYSVDVSVDGENTTVWVADGQTNNRVLRYDNPSTNGAAANGVLGQVDYTSRTTGTTASTFKNPLDVSVDAAGRLYVADDNNGRIMIFNDAANKLNGAAADNVLGAPDFTTKVTSNGDQNHFYFRFDPEFSSWHVGFVTVDAVNNKLLVSDRSNQRVMQFAASSPLPVELTSFSASVNGSSVVLNWQTATEVDNYGFEEERASSPTTPVQGWDEIGFVAGHGNSYSPKDYEFVDENPPSEMLKYRLKQIDFDGKYEYYSLIAEVDASVLTSVNDDPSIAGLPTEYALYQNYPNPFNPSTVIKFQVPSSKYVKLQVYDVLGSEVQTLVNEQIKAGNYEVVFNAAGLPSGIYFYRLETADFVQARKLLLVK
ncbi:MAG: T9SS type A sorting domain-containing protein [Bacteroidetes bacterium]|nr:T9SS type A sorting domain-containing protein [Bacteroidota bacterium]